jgi:hypothetical protein
MLELSTYIYSAIQLTLSSAVLSFGVYALSLSSSARTWSTIEPASSTVINKVRWILIECLKLIEPMVKCIVEAEAELFPRSKTVTVKH